MKFNRDQLIVIIAGLIIGIICSLLVLAGNPTNMGACIACFIRDISGALGLHSATPVQYMRPEIIGIVLGGMAVALYRKEISPEVGSSPMQRFVLAICTMIGCMMFLGCPLRAVLGLAGGNLNALVGILGFATGIFTGVFFIKRGYSLKRTNLTSSSDAYVFPLLIIALLGLLLFAPTLLKSTLPGKGPGATHAPIYISLTAGLIIGGICQYSRFCMISSFRDIFLFKSLRPILPLVALLLGTFICNLILTSLSNNTYFKLGFENQPLSHTHTLWNFLGLYLAGFSGALLGGCPLRQLTLAAQGNIDSVITIIGLLVGAAICHNFSWVASPAGPSSGGKTALIGALFITLLIALLNTFNRKHSN